MCLYGCNLKERTIKRGLFENQNQIERLYIIFDARISYKRLDTDMPIIKRKYKKNSQTQNQKNCMKN